jgi:hypothetical protein
MPERYTRGYLSGSGYVSLSLSFEFSSIDQTKMNTWMVRSDGGNALNLFEKGVVGIHYGIPVDLSGDARGDACGDARGDARGGHGGNRHDRP